MAAVSVLCCSICLDESEEIAFHCCNRACAYCLCSPCVRRAFDDYSGMNSSNCQFCGIPSAMDMITAICGAGAISAVEKKIRSSLEFELKEDMVKQQRAKQVVTETNTRARDIFNNLTEEINLKCPRCMTVFHDYDGCNALICATGSCKAAFCAICLEDCGRDAHAHVRENHGSLFDKVAFKKSKSHRARVVVGRVLSDLSNEPSFELVQQVKNHIAKAQLLQVDEREGFGMNKSRTFLRSAKEDLLKAAKNDRLSILLNPETYQPGLIRLTADGLSPRSSIPADFRVTLSHGGNRMYTLRLECEDDNGRWKFVSLDKVKDELKDKPKVEALSNLKQGIKCAVIAFEGHRALFQSQFARAPKEGHFSEDEICITLTQISLDGSTGRDADDFKPLGRELRVIGLNPNLRMLMFEKHILETSDTDLLFTPLRHLVGDGKPVPVLDEMLRPVPATYNELNNDQQEVAHPLRLKTAGEVAGPPGTGKTKTIVELVRGLLETTNLDVVVLSERNGAINAIAEKFKEACLDDKEKSVKDMLVWSSIITYGSGEAMGSATKLFTLEGKLSYHPKLCELQEKVDLFNSASSQLLKEMKNRIANDIDAFGEEFNVDRAYDRSHHIRSLSSVLTSPLVILRYLTELLEDMRSLFPKTHRTTIRVNEEDIAALVSRRSELLGGLVKIRTDPEKKNSTLSWDAKEAILRLSSIADAFEELLELDIFNESKATELCKKLGDAKKDYQNMHERLSKELPQNARLHMSTIGSSHKLSRTKASDIADELKLLSLDDYCEDDDSDRTPKKTVIIFDEAGCIPSYELLGLSRLGRDIEAILLVGDEHQLPPYDPCSGRHSKSNIHRAKDRYGNRARFKTVENEGQSSLLDSSTLSTHDGKVKLTSQYRVPKDIADILNFHIYKGSYVTSPNAGVPSVGLKVINVPEEYNSNRKYVNNAEVDQGIALIDELNLEDDISSILLITPYKKQQREFEFRLRNARIKKPVTVLTIDQCQGQEADAVIFSTVQKPTRFLNKNRLNVALSRVRKKLFVLVDKRKLRDACSNNKWDAALLASELIQNDED